MYILLAVVCGYILDLILGDPAWMPHPVIFMGKYISKLEKFIRPRFPKTPKGELTGGLIVTILLPLTTLIIVGGLCWLGYVIHPGLGFALQVLWCWQALATKGLASEAANVQKKLDRHNLPAARKAVARIVGRDTQALTEEGVTKAAVETVAENFADGVSAPLLYMLIGGAPLALMYKSVNTMGSMLGYKNDKYLYFGRTAAHLDDIVGYIPARLAAIFWIIGAGLTGHSMKNAWRIWRRDNRNHASPNSAQTESACAGALGVQLAGPAYYFGTLYEKPTIGDADRPVEPADIGRANKMLYAAGITMLIVGGAIRALVVLWS